MRALHRLLWLTVLAAISGCQCLVPVDEPDAGRDAGVDGGADAGMLPDGGCARAAQCTAPPRDTAGWCATSPVDAGFSCIERTCLWECPLTSAGRNCTVDQGSYCLRCGDAGTACPLTSNCGSPANMGTAQVEPGSLCPGVLTSVTLLRTASAQCRYLVSGAGDSLGDLWRLDDGEYLAWFPSLGGWCTGRSAFTGVPRGIFNCPACQFVLEGFE